MMNTGMILNTMSALLFVSKHDLAGPVEEAGVEESYPVREVQSKAPENAL